jgi:hypothetical protein
MQKYRYIPRIIGAIFLTIALSSASFATWKQIFQFPFPICSCFFLDANHGVAGSGVYGPNYTLQIWVTSNGGTSWTQAGVPVGDGEVTQIVIKPDGTGYASIFSEHNPNNNLWSTADGGYTWKDISTGYHYGTGVGFGGQTSQWTAPRAPGNNTNGVFAMPGGKTFITPGPNPGGEAWSAYGDPVSNVWYMVTELSRDLYISTNSGVTWKQRYNFGSLLINGGIPTGNIVGLGNKLFIQTEKNGMFVGSTLDTGTSWTHLAGSPSNEADSRTIYVSGCNGEVIYAFDDAGILWKSADANTDSLHMQHIDFHTITACQNMTKKAWFRNNSNCAPFVVTSATFINATGVYSLLQSIILPDTLQPGDTAFFMVAFDPKLKPGGYNAQIQLQGYFEAVEGSSQKEADSIITIVGEASPVAPQTKTNLSDVDFGGTSICGGEVDTIFTLKNIGCDTLRLLNGPGSLDSAFILDSIKFPFLLPPDSTIVIHVHFKPLHAGQVSSFPDFKISSEGIGDDIKFFVQGTGIAGVGVLTLGTQTFPFDTLSICSPADSLSGYFTNIGCGPLVVDNITPSGNNDFNLSGLTSGMEIAPGDTLFYKIRFTPQLKGSRAANFLAVVKDKNGATQPRNITLSVTCFVESGIPILSSTLASINFGTTSLCDEKDSLITLRNTGCDTLTVTKAQVFGAGFVVSGNSFPIIIPPQKSAQITVTTLLDTAGGKLVSIDSLKITSNSDSAFAAIKLTRSVIPHRAVGMYLDAAAKRGTDQNVVTYDIKETPGRSFTGAGVSRIDFDLVRNTDLLEFIPAQSSASLSGTPNGQSFSLTSGSEITADANGILATAAFRIYLTKDSTTDIALANVKMNGLDSSGGPCLLTFSTSGVAHFNYDFACGELSIAGSMDGITPLKIVSLRPNPAQDEIELLLGSALSQEATIEISNSLGAKIFSQYQHLTAGQNIFHVDLRNLSGGLYLARIHSDNFSASQKFLKVE